MSRAWRIIGTHDSKISTTFGFRLEARLAALSALCLRWAGLMNWMVRMCAELEVSMNSVERMIEYMPMESEAPAIVDDSRPPDDWPHEGAINIQNLVVRYRPELPPVIGGLSFATRAREKVGLAAPLTKYNPIPPCLPGYV